MILKTRKESVELKLLRSLNNRLNLSDEEGQYYRNLEKGFEGEIKFDKWLLNHPNADDWIILCDLLLESNNTTFQIDTLLITDETTYLFEVKNYEGDFFYDKGRWYTIAKKEIKDPIQQLERNESLLRQLLQSLNTKATIESYVIFINPDFHLYQAPINLPIIFPTQLNRFSKKLSRDHGKSNKRGLQLANNLVSRHQHESPFKRFSNFSYERIKNGITCNSCYAFLKVLLGKLECSNCSYVEDIDSAILRSIEEYRILFPDRIITTNAIYHWCQIIESKKTIRRILSRNYKKMGEGRSTYYKQY